MSYPNTKRTRRPGNSFPLVVAAAVIGTIFLVKNPEPINYFFDSVAGSENHPPADAVPAGKQGAKPPAEKPNPKSARGSSRLPAAELTPPDVIEVAAAPDAGPVPAVGETPLVKEDPSNAKVKTDSAVAYSSSSSRSAVVSVLKKDTRVETTLELVNSEGRWSMIRTEDLDRPVFVRSESLARSQ